MWQIEDEIALESFDRYAPQSCEFRHAAIIKAAHPWLPREKGTRLIHGGKVSFGELIALFLTEIDELLKQVNPRRGRWVTDWITSWSFSFAQPTSSWPPA